MYSIKIHTKVALVKNVPYLSNTIKDYFNAFRNIHTRGSKYRLFIKQEIYVSPKINIYKKICYAYDIFFQLQNINIIQSIIRKNHHGRRYSFTAVICLLSHYRDEIVDFSHTEHAADH